MKNIILILMLTISSLVKCQINSNIITEIDFNNIKINNVSLNQIKATNGIYSQIISIIPNTIIEKTEDTEEDYYYYVYNGFNISFSENEISSFEIVNSNWNIEIKGKKLRIGSNIRILEKVNINNQKDGGRSIVYQYCDGCNNFLSIYIDSNNLVTKIIYIEQT